MSRLTVGGLAALPRCFENDPKCVFRSGRDDSSQSPKSGGCGSGASGLSAVRSNWPAILIASTVSRAFSRRKELGRIEAGTLGLGDA
eukprot:s2229_g11.t1